MYKICERLSHLVGHIKNNRIPGKVLGTVALIDSTASKTWTRCVSYLSGKKDKYNGLHISLDQLTDSCTPVAFEEILQASLQKWKSQEVTAVWLKVPIMQSGLIATAAQHGFQFHHAEGGHSTLCQWMGDLPSKLPMFATHQIGVSGCVVHETTKEPEVLVVRDRNRPFTLWKFPGGLAELTEDIGETAEREVLEETGVKAEFQGILAFRQQHHHPGAFGRSDIFFVCRMRPLTFELNPCSHEIEACQWMTLDELARTNQTSAITQKIIYLIRLGLEEGFDRVDVKSEQFKSVYKGLVFQLYSRVSAESDEETLGKYQHSLTDDHKSDLTRS